MYLYISFSLICDIGAGSNALAKWLDLTGSEFVGKYEAISSIQFAKFISWYLFANGKTLYLSEDNMYQIIMESKHNREHYAYNINQMKKAVEEILTSKNTYYNPISISVKSNSLFKGTCYKGNYCQKKEESQIYFSDSGIFYDDTTALDWGYAIGESLCTMSAEAFMKNGEYYMNFRYYIIDNYEYAYHWEEEEGNISIPDKAGHRLHETGTGREFKIIGVYNDVIKWKPGEILYPNDYVEIKLEEEKYNAEPYR